MVRLTTERASRPTNQTRFARAIGAATTAMLVLVGLVAVPQAAVAAGAPFVSGVVTSDSNADGAVSTSTAAGAADKPIAGALVELMCAASGDVLASVTTPASGAYEFGDGDLGSCAGDVSLRIRTDQFLAGIYATEAGSAANDFVRSTPSLATVPAFTPNPASPVTKNALLAPAWRSSLALAGDPDGWQDQAVKTGAAPFDASEAQPGWDSAADNGVVRAGDAVTYTFSATFDSPDPLGASASSAIFEQVIELNDGAVANFARIPAVCSGTNPASSIRAMPSNTVIQGTTVPPAGTTRVVLTCNLGAIGAERQALLPTTSVWVSATSENDSTFTTEARLYGVDANGVTTIRPSAPVENGPIEITSQPRYDLVKKPYTVSGLTTTNIAGVTTAGYFVYWHVYLTTDRKVGVEAPQQPITFSEDFFGQHTTTSAAGTMGNTVDGLKYYVTQCIPAPDGPIFGNKASYPNNTAQSASNSGTCAFARDAAGDTAPYTMTLTGVDTSGAHYPTVDRNGSSLAAGPFYVAAYRLQIFVPLTEVDRADGAATDGAGSMSVSNLVGDFDPNGVSGASNYGDGLEPGYCADGTPTSDDGTLEFDCDLMEDGKRSNNVAGPMTLTVSPGSWAKYNFDLPAGWVHSEQLLPGAGASHDGAATLQPGQTGSSDIRIGNGGASPMTGIAMCDIFDNTTMKLTTLDKVVNNASTFTGAYDLSTRYAYVLENGPGVTSSTNLAYQDNWVVQYAHFDFGADNVIGGGFNATYNRYDGNWANQRNASCADGAAENTTGWVTSVAAAGGIDAVNGVRVVAKSGYGLPSASYAHLKVAYEQRDTFNGGPNAGQKIPSGTVAANFARVRADSYQQNWTTRAYIPMSAAGESGNADGDRWTVTRAEMNLKKRTITVDGVGTGAADIGNTGTAIAGNKVVWEVISTLTAAAAQPAPVNNVVITDTLPKYSIYNEACTAALAGGTPATSYTVNADGTTTLVWNLGTRTPNTEIPNRRICTDTDPLAPNGTTLTNVAVITSPDVTPVSVHKDDHTVVLEQTGELRLRKDVDATLDLEDDNQVYTLRLKNFSDTLAVQRPTVIDVLPANGDGTSAAGVNRDPASDYVGTSGLTGPVTAFDWSGSTPVAGTVYYTTVPTASIPQDLNADTNPAIWSTTVADYSTVTGFKFVATGNLAVAGGGNSSGIVLKYSTKQTNNDPGDLYSNRFTAFSQTFQNAGKYQLLTSNQVTVRVVGFSLGDLIWTDENADGKFTDGVDTKAPAGVQVQVFKDGQGTPVATTTTNDQGRWIVNDLSKGDYYVVIPASQFAAGGPLANRVVSTVNSVADPDNDANEGSDHHAIAFPVGVRSAGLVHLDATVDGSTITGQEPTGDNVGGLRPSPGTTDDFTNLTVDLALQRVPGYAFTKSASPASGSSVLPGDTVTYTLTGTNTGSAPLDVTIGDDVSQVLSSAVGGDIVAGSLTATITGTNAPATTPAPTKTGNAIAWTGVLTEGQHVAVTYQVVVAEDATGETLKNVATSTGTPAPSLGEPITPAEVSTNHPVPGYTFTKSGGPAAGVAVPVGGGITYTLTGTNTGATPLTVAISDNLADVLDDATVGSLVATITGPDAPATTPAPTLTGDTLSWSGSLAVGQKVVLTYVATVKDGAQADNSTLVNAATSTARTPDGKALSGQGATTNPVPGYTFAKVASPATGSTMLPGEEITYTLTGTNTGATSLDPVTVSDDLTKVLAAADGGAIVAGSLTTTVGGSPAASAATVTGNTLSWTGPLAVGQNVVITYKIKIAADAAGKTLTNTASSSATPPNDLAPIAGTGTTTHPVAGYTFAKTSTPGDGRAVATDGSVTYLLTGTNTGATVLDPVTITDDLSGVADDATIGAPVVTITGPGAPATAPAATVSGTTLSWTGTLAVGQKVEITYPVSVNAGQDLDASVLKNAAMSSATPPGRAPFTGAGDVDNPVPGFTLGKVAEPATTSIVQPGDTITYTVTGTNTGATALTPVVVTDDASKVLAHATLVQDSLVATVTGGQVATDAPDPTLAEQTGMITWTGTLAVGQVVTITYQVTVNEDADGVVLQNLASGTATPPDGLPPITPAPVETVHPTPGFSFVKTANPVSTTPVVSGQEITYTLVATNFGETRLEDVTVTDDLAQVLPFADVMTASLKATIDGEPTTAPTVSGSTLTWMGDLAAGEVVTVTYTVKVKADIASATSVLENLAAATATPPGKEPLTPEPSGTTHPVAGFALTKTANPATTATVNAGDIISYTLTGTNLGATALQHATITDDLSKVLTGAKVDGEVKVLIIHKDGSTTAGTATISGTTLSWTGTLDVGDKVTISYGVKVAAAAKATTVTNSVSATWTAPGGTPQKTDPITTVHQVKPVAAPAATAATGASGAPWLAGGAALLIALGGVLILVRRRSNKTA